MKNKKLCLSWRKREYFVYCVKSEQVTPMQVTVSATSALHPSALASALLCWALIKIIFIGRQTREFIKNYFLKYSSKGLQLQWTLWGRVRLSTLGKHFSWVSWERCLRSPKFLLLWGRSGRVWEKDSLIWTLEVPSHFQHRNHHTQPLVHKSLCDVCTKTKWKSQWGNYELKETLFRRFWVTASHRMWSKTLSLAIAVAVQVDSFGQKLCWSSRTFYLH